MSSEPGVLIDELRSLATAIEASDYYFHDDLLVEAADEIERLQAEVLKLRADLAFYDGYRQAIEEARQRGRR